MEQVLKGAVSLSTLLWARETEGGVFETPERRAALEQRLSELIATIGDDTIKRHYRDDLFGRLADTFGRGQRRNAPKGERGGGRNFVRGSEPFPQQRPSPSLLASGLVRGPHAAMPKREAAILAMVINHPWLLYDHDETFAALDFRNAEAVRLKDALLDIYALDQAQDREQLLAALEQSGEGPRLLRAAAQAIASALSSAGEGAAPEDVKVVWSQLLALHQKMQALHKELKDAEQALADDFNEANQSWLFDVKRRQEELNGMDALIEGFGAASGR